MVDYISLHLFTFCLPFSVIIMNKFAYFFHRIQKLFAFWNDFYILHDIFIFEKYRNYRVRKS